jgi:hypothetical protein
MTSDEDGIGRLVEGSPGAAAQSVEGEVNGENTSDPGPGRPPPAQAAGAHPAGIGPSAGCGCDTSTRSLIYAIGTIGFDFGTEARRDGFRQQMGLRERDEDGHTSVVPSNPYDPTQLAPYLKANPWASSKLIWTLNLDQTPIYALEAEPSVGMFWGDPVPDESSQRGRQNATETPPDPTEFVNRFYPPVSYVHQLFHDAIVGQTLQIDDPNLVSRVSVPGVLTNRTVRLFSGQTIPVVVAAARGMYSWNESALVAAVAGEVQRAREELDAAVARETVELTVRAFLDKIYYQFRNLGQTSPDRALNFAATNVFVFTEEISKGLLSGGRMPRHTAEPAPLYTLDTIDVVKSPVCRMDSDCWDVRITFFDPENERRARSVLLFTIDVSDELPVTLAPTRQYLIGS